MDEKEYISLYYVDCRKQKEKNKQTNKQIRTL